MCCLGVGWLAMPPNREGDGVWAWWEGLCRCHVPVLGSSYKYSKLCTSRTHAASLGNSRDLLRRGRRC